MARLLEIIKPNRIKVLVLVVLMIMSVLIATETTATSKVSWEEIRGFPARIVKLSFYKGPCPENDICRNIKIPEIHTGPLILDVLFWYLVSCFLVFSLLPKKQNQFDQ